MHACSQRIPREWEILRIPREWEILSFARLWSVVYCGVSDNT